MRILFIVPTLMMGGTEKQILLISKGLVSEKKCHVEVMFLYRGGEVEKQLREYGIKVNCIGMKNIYDFRFVPKMVRIIKNGRFDIVHNFLFDANVLGSITAYCAGVKVILGSRRDLDVWKKSRHIVLEKLASLFCKRIIVNANAIKDFVIRQEKIAPHKIEVIYNGVGDNCQLRDDKSLGNKDRVFGISDDTKIITMIGTLSKKKRQDIFLKSAWQVIQKHKNVRFVLVGRGPEEQSLKKLAEKLEIEKSVVFMSFRSDVREILAETDLLVLTSDFEGFPNVILEAMACGLPVVATRVGGTPEAIENGKSGILVEPDNPLAVSAAITALLQKEDLRKEMGRQGKKIAEQKFSLKKMIDSYSVLYSQLLESSSALGVS